MLFSASVVAKYSQHPAETTWRSWSNPSLAFLADFAWVEQQFRIRTFLGWIVEGIELTIVPSALKDMDLPGVTENVSGLSAASDDNFFCC